MTVGRPQLIPGYNCKKKLDHAYFVGSGFVWSLSSQLSPFAVIEVTCVFPSPAGQKYTPNMFDGASTSRVGIGTLDPSG